MARYDQLPGKGRTQDLPLTNDKTARAPKVRLESDGTGRMTASEVREGRVTRELGRGRAGLPETHRHVAQQRAKMGISSGDPGVATGRHRGTHRFAGRIVMHSAGTGPARGATEGTDTAHAPACPAVFGDGDPCSCGAGDTAEGQGGRGGPGRPRRAREAEEGQGGRGHRGGLGGSRT